MFMHCNLLIISNKLYETIVSTIIKVVKTYRNVKLQSIDY